MRLCSLGMNAVVDLLISWQQGAVCHNIHVLTSKFKAVGFRSKCQILKITLIWIFLDFETISIKFTTKRLPWNMDFILQLFALLVVLSRGLSQGNIVLQSALFVYIINILIFFSFIEKFWSEEMLFWKHLYTVSLKS